MNIKEIKTMRTAKQWLAQKDKRYPVRGAQGTKGKRGEYFHIGQTNPVRSEATHHPFFNVTPVADTYKSITYYYFDECEEKRTPNQWLKIGRKVEPGSVPCFGSRSGFNPLTKQHIEINCFLKSDTSPLKNSRL